ncbi:MAG: hypothetical protein Q8K63_15055 [Acidimicrobiales bacterium]|nr:hypothetical protein [Acidimicrobiales bacterium]
MLRRVAFLVGGAAVASLAFAATIKAALGLGPLFVVQEGIAGQLDISIGRAVMIVGSCLCVIALAMREWPGVGTVVLPFLIGAMVDGVLPHTPTPGGVVLRVVVVVVSTFAMALGGALIINSRLGAGAPDLLMLGLSRLTGVNNRSVRLALEAGFLLLGWLLGGVVGIGSVVTGVLIGPMLHFWIERLHSEPVEHEHLVV